MSTDRFGMTTATADESAIDALEQATYAIAAHKPGGAVALDAALDAAPDCVAAQALLGFANVMLARRETTALAKRGLSRARASLEQAGGSCAEAAMVDALALAVNGGLSSAADRLDDYLIGDPGAFVIAKLSHSLRFMTGDALGMMNSVDRTLAVLPESHPGYGFALGCRAFAMEELGAYDAAEKIGRRAVDIEPEDSWAIHAVGHVHEMTGRAADGLAWIESRRATWKNCNNFALHMSWHSALFHLELGRLSQALDIFDNEVWPRASDDFRDMSNAVALLVRVEQFGVDVCARWRGPAAIAAARAGDTTLTFAALHNLAALAASGNLREARELATAIEAPGSKDDDQEEVRACAGRPLARAILGLAERNGGAVDFAAILRELPRIGGSNAQRDVFVRLLARLASERRDITALEAILSTRRILKRDDSFVALLRARFHAAGTRGQQTFAANAEPQFKLIA